MACTAGILSPGSVPVGEFGREQERMMNVLSGTAPEPRVEKVRVCLGDGLRIVLVALGGVRESCCGRLSCDLFRLFGSGAKSGLAIPGHSAPPESRPLACLCSWVAYGTLTPAHLRRRPPATRAEALR